MSENVNVKTNNEEVKDQNLDTKEKSKKVSVKKVTKGVLTGLAVIVGGYLASKLALRTVGKPNRYATIPGEKRETIDAREGFDFREAVPETEKVEVNEG